MALEIFDPGTVADSATLRLAPAYKKYMRDNGPLFQAGKLPSAPANALQVLFKDVPYKDLVANFQVPVL